jgi:hypothetical protein
MRNTKKKKKINKQTHTSTKVVIAAICAIVLFWISEFFLLYTGNSGFPDGFIKSWFFFWSVELAALAGIKITKVRRQSPYEGEMPDDAFEESEEEAVG